MIVPQIEKLVRWLDKKLRCYGKVAASRQAIFDDSQLSIFAVWCEMKREKQKCFHFFFETK